MFLETERLILRKFREEDFDDFCDYTMDDEMSRMMGRDRISTRADARLAFMWLKNRVERGYALELKSTGRVIGSLRVCQVPRFDEAVRRLGGWEGRSLSFAISRHFRRQGLMEEAVRAAIAALFEEGMDYIQCGCFDFNTASRALQEKLGFQYLTTERIDLGGKRCTAIQRILWK